MSEPRRTRKPQEPAFLDIFERRVRLEGYLTTRTGLHIGAGGSGDPIGTDSPVVRDGLGRPMIPGASLKGVMRSAAEALFRHLPRSHDENLPPLWTCDIVGKNSCVDHDQLKELRDALPERAEPKDLRALAEKAWRRSCTICRLFGSMAMAGRVRFPDLLLIADEEPLMEVRNGVGIDRDKGQAAAGVLYDFEAVPPGTRFGLSVIVDNYDDFEIGLLLYLFDELDRGSLVLGGKTTRGLGQVSIEWQHIEEMSLDPSAGGESNPFAKLLKRELFQDQDDAGPGELPIPETGEAKLWQRLAEPLDALDSVDKNDVSRAWLAFNPTKAAAVARLGAESGRQTFPSMLRALVACGRLVKRDQLYVSKAKIEEERAAALDGARTPAWLLSQYDRFIGAMDQLWKEAV